MSAQRIFRIKKAAAAFVAGNFLSAPRQRPAREIALNKCNKFLTQV
jgi:hypothetical protein